jgi:DNA-binding CsgD family transcriptional regulator
MSAGIRATVELDATEACPLAALSVTEGTAIRSVSTSVATPDSPTSVTEFQIATDEPVADERFTHVISYGDTDVYRFDHDGDQDCPCVVLGRFDCPVARLVADGGTLTVTFHAADFDRLQELVGALRETFPEIDITRLVRDPDETAPETVLVDRGQLTDRQFEVLRTAYEMGYFERPKGANATDVADELGINRSTFSEHVSAAERKILTDVLE